MGLFSHSVFNPMSPQGLAISHLFIWVMIASGFILLGLVGTLAITLPRFRHRPGQGDPPQTFGRVDMEIAWTVGPIVLLCVVFGTTISAMTLSSPPGIDPPGGKPAVSNLTVIGHQWWWEYHYADGLVAANELHIPTGRRWLVSYKSADVIHSFWIPQLEGKIDSIPGQTNHMYLEADRAGTYWGNCSEFCGTGHAWMLPEVIAESPAQFAAWQRHQLQPARPPTTPLALQGLGVYTTYTCYVCHNIRGLVPNQKEGPTSDVIAPDLTHFASRSWFAGGRLPNTPANVEAWLHDPQLLKPGVHMPNLQLSDSQIRALTAFLESLK